MTFAREFAIAGRAVGPGHPCLVIAEAGVNHFGDMDKALALVDLAVDAGADVLKIQHFRTDVLVGPSAPDWRERLRSKELSDTQVLRIRDHCDRRGILFMCTGHDEDSLDFLDREAGVPAFKVGSGEVGNWPSLTAMARRGKPIILSTGMYEMADISAALEAIAAGGGREVAVLHCVTSYPTDPADVNLAVMGQIRDLFPGPVGYSDHTTGTAVPLAAVALGADVIEKHITIDRDVPNAQDWKVSCDPSNLAAFVAGIREVEAARGGAPKALATAERQSLLWARKSLTAARDIAAGECLTADMLVAQRPGDGLPPSRIGEVVGRTAHRSFARGTKIDPAGLT
ncbi:MAG: N-acetylneuraminate synthase family protein [Hyphomicrobiales bacterium]|nr:N-acetylneuraminate synthase family protein [Hyphomicrobiales bacterium]MCP5370543.1 N-acetylneuraminate synthase family protein [Hyphomicrobiales bacterium]